MKHDIWENKSILMQFGLSSTLSLISLKICSNKSDLRNLGFVFEIRDLGSVTNGAPIHRHTCFDRIPIQNRFVFY